MAEKTRYSDAELEEFRAIIMEKLEDTVELMLIKILLLNLECGLVQNSNYY